MINKKISFNIKDNLNKNQRGRTLKDNDSEFLNESLNITVSKSEEVKIGEQSREEDKLQVNESVESNIQGNEENVETDHLKGFDNIRDNTDNTTPNVSHLKTTTKRGIKSSADRFKQMKISDFSNETKDERTIERGTYRIPKQTETNKSTFNKQKNYVNSRTDEKVVMFARRGWGKRRRRYIRRKSISATINQSLSAHQQLRREIKRLMTVREPLAKRTKLDTSNEKFASTSPNKLYTPCKRQLKVVLNRGEVEAFLQKNINVKQERNLMSPSTLNKYHSMETRSSSDLKHKIPKNKVYAQSDFNSRKKVCERKHKVDRKQIEDSIASNRRQIEEKVNASERIVKVSCENTMDSHTCSTNKQKKLETPSVKGNNIATSPREMLLKDIMIKPTKPGLNLPQNTLRTPPAELSTKSNDLPKPTVGIFHIQPRSDISKPVKNTSLPVYNKKDVPPVKKVGEEVVLKRLLSSKENKNSTSKHTLDKTEPTILEVYSLPSSLVVETKFLTREEYIRKNLSTHTKYISPSPNRKLRNLNYSNIKHQTVISKKPSVNSAITNISPQIVPNDSTVIPSKVSKVAYQPVSTPVVPSSSKSSGSINSNMTKTKRSSITKTITGNIQTNRTLQQVVNPQKELIQPIFDRIQKLIDDKVALEVKKKLQEISEGFSVSGTTPVIMKPTPAKKQINFPCDIRTANQIYFILREYLDVPQNLHEANSSSACDQDNFTQNPKPVVTEIKKVSNVVVRNNTISKCNEGRCNPIKDNSPDTFPFRRIRLPPKESETTDAEQQSTVGKFYISNATGSQHVNTLTTTAPSIITSTPYKESNVMEQPIMTPIVHTASKSSISQIKSSVEVKKIKPPELITPDTYITIKTESEDENEQVENVQSQNTGQSLKITDVRSVAEISIVSKENQIKNIESPNIPENSTNIQNIQVISSMESLNMVSKHSDTNNDSGTIVISGSKSVQTTQLTDEEEVNSINTKIPIINKISEDKIIIIDDCTIRNDDHDTSVIDTQYTEDYSLDTGYQFKCQNCSVILSSRPLIQDHVQRIHFKSSKNCYLCGIQLEQPHSLQHFLDKHSDASISK